MFGCSLTSLCQRESGSVPQFVTMCIDHVENTGRVGFRETLFRGMLVVVETHWMKNIAWILFIKKTK